MKTMERTSVVMATYNGARYVKGQLESLSRQTSLPDELIVTDDRSTDDTVAIVEQFARTAPFPVSVSVNPENLGYKENFYRAVGRSRHEIIMLCDQDDIWFPDKIEKLRRQFEERTDLLLVYHHAVTGDEHGNITGTIGDPAQQHASLAAPMPAPWFFARGLLQAFRRNLTDHDDLRPLCRSHIAADVIGHDRWYFLLALAQGRIRFLEENLVLYRQHGGNAFGTDARHGLAGRLKHHLNFSEVDHRYAAKAARSRARVLRRLYDRAREQDRARVDLFANRYALLADRLERRVRIHRAPGLPARLSSLATALRSRDYTGKPWGFAPHSLARDLLLGVMRLPAPRIPA